MMDLTVTNEDTKTMTIFGLKLKMDLLMKICLDFINLLRVRESNPYEVKDQP